MLVNGIVLGKPYPGQAPKSTVADVGDNCAPCHAIPLAEPGCAGPERVRGVPCLQAQRSWGWIGGYAGSLSVEMAEPKYPTVPTSGNNKGLSLPGIWNALSQVPQNHCHSLASSHR